VVTQSFLSTAYGGFDLTHSRTSNKFYFEDDNGLSVMDGSSDSLLGVIEMEHRFGRLSPCWCPEGNKVYCFANRGERMYVAVVDCDTDSVAREMDIYDWVQGFEYLGEGRMLCLQYEHLTLIDTRTDSVLVDSAFERSLPYYSSVHTGDGKKVYILRNGLLKVRSSGSLSLLATIDWPYAAHTLGGFLVYSDTTRKLYWFAEQADSVLAVDATSDTVVARMPISGWREGVCLDHTGRYLFCFAGSLRVYDTQTDSLVAECQIPVPAVSVTPNPERGCIYVGYQDMILVYSDVPPGVEEAMNAEVRATKSGPTVVSGVLVLSAVGSRQNAEYRAGLMDISGRKVMDLRPGPNDVRMLAPGVYFIREGQAQDRATRKVILTR
jgi:hypothetical protein